MVLDRWYVKSRTTDAQYSLFHQNPKVKNFHMLCQNTPFVLWHAHVFFAQGKKDKTFELITEKKFTNNAKYFVGRMWRRLKLTQEMFVTKNFERKNEKNEEGRRDKVHMFWEGHKSLRNLHLTFVAFSEYMNFITKTNVYSF